jgi:hypothetical protein
VHARRRASGDSFFWRMGTFSSETTDGSLSLRCTPLPAALRRIGEQNPRFLSPMYRAMSLKCISFAIPTHHLAGMSRSAVRCLAAAHWRARSRPMSARQRYERSAVRCHRFRCKHQSVATTPQSVTLRFFDTVVRFVQRWGGTVALRVAGAESSMPRCSAPSRTGSAADASGLLGLRKASAPATPTPLHCTNPATVSVFSRIPVPSPLPMGIRLSKPFSARPCARNLRSRDRRAQALRAGASLFEELWMALPAATEQ